MHITRRLWQGRIEAVRLYYKSPQFALIDLVFGLIALFLNPYRTCRKFLQKKGAENIYAYGETPYSTYQKIVKECGIGPQDTWIEMGSGRGKGCFWLAHFIRCRVIGIEWIPQFTLIARAIKALFRMERVQFIRSDIEEVNLSEATVIYLYGLWPNLQIGEEMKVITISEPLEGYTVLKSFWVRFPWGRTKAYLQKR
jgi:hypothetical protein